MADNVSTVAADLAAAIPSAVSAQEQGLSLSELQKSVLAAKAALGTDDAGEITKKLGEAVAAALALPDIQPDADKIGSKDLDLSESKFPLPASISQEQATIVYAAFKVAYDQIMKLKQEPDNNEMLEVRGIFFCLFPPFFNCLRGSGRGDNCFCDGCWLARKILRVFSWTIRKRPCCQ